MTARKLIRLQRAGLLQRAAWITTEDMATHILVTGGVGSGKTSCILAELVRENVRAGAAMLVFAGKATDAQTFERFIRQGGGASPLRLGSDPNLYFPLLEYLDGLGMSSPDIASVLKEAAAAMKQSGEIGAESEDWQTRALDVITKTFILRRLVGPLSLIPLLKLLARLPHIPAQKKLRKEVLDGAGRPVPRSQHPEDGKLPEEWRVCTIPNVVLSPEWTEVVAAAHQNGAFEVQEALHYMLSTWPQMNDRTATSITSQFIVLLSRLGQEPLLSLLRADDASTKTAVTPDTLFVEGQHVIVDVPTTSNPESGRAAQAMFQRAMRLAMVHRERNADGDIVGPLVVGMLDEFQQSVSDAKSLVELLQISREFKYGLVLSTQNVSNVVFRFGQDGANAILGLPETKIAARNTDMPTCRMISDAVGLEEREVKSVQRDSNGRTSTSVTLQERVRIRPESIAKLYKVKWTNRGRPQSETLVLHDGQNYLVLWDGLPRGWDRILRRFWIYREKDRGVIAVAALLLPIVLNFTYGSTAVDESEPADSRIAAMIRETGAPGTQSLEGCGRPARYRVQRGDTLARIGETYGLDFRQIARLNGLADPNALEVGQVLTVPSPPCADPVRLDGLRRVEAFWSSGAGLYAGVLLAALFLAAHALFGVLRKRRRGRDAKQGAGSVRHRPATAPQPTEAARGSGMKWLLNSAVGPAGGCHASWTPAAGSRRALWTPLDPQGASLRNRVLVEPLLRGDAISAGPCGFGPMLGDRVKRRHPHAPYARLLESPRFQRRYFGASRRHRGERRGSKLRPASRAISAQIRSKRCIAPRRTASRFAPGTNLGCWYEPGPRVVRTWAEIGTSVR